MKKILSFLIMFSLLFGVVGVVGETETQGANGTITTDFNFTATPNPLLFGNMIPDEIKSLTSNLDIGTSNLQVSGISVTPDVGTIFIPDNVKFDIDGNGFVAPIDVPVFVIYAIDGYKDIQVQLHIPIATPAESFSGTITYTITEVTII